MNRIVSASVPAPARFFVQNMLRSRTVPAVVDFLLSVLYLFDVQEIFVLNLRHSQHSSHYLLSFSANKHNTFNRFIYLARAKGIEPLTAVLETAVIPFNYARPCQIDERLILLCGGNRPAPSEHL